MGEPATSTSQRARQREETRERIFEAAVDEFRRVGFREAQIPRIADAAGVVRGTFYFHFASKDEVLEELARRLRAEITTAARDARARSTSLREMLCALVAAIARVDSELVEGELVHDVVHAYLRPQLAAEATEHGDEIQSELTRQVALAIERGELREGLDPERVASIVLRSIFGMMASSRLPGLEQRAELQLLVDLLLDGLHREGRRTRSEGGTP